MDQIKYKEEINNIYNSILNIGDIHEQLITHNTYRLISKEFRVDSKFLRSGDEYILDFNSYYNIPYEYLGYKKEVSVVVNKIVDYNYELILDRGYIEAKKYVEDNLYIIRNYDCDMFKIDVVDDLFINTIENSGNHKINFHFYHIKDCFGFYNNTFLNNLYNIKGIPTIKNKTFNHIITTKDNFLMHKLLIKENKESIYELYKDCGMFDILNDHGFIESILDNGDIKLSSKILIPLSKISTYSRNTIEFGIK